MSFSENYELGLQKVKLSLALCIILNGFQKFSLVFVTIRINEDINLEIIASYSLINQSQI